MNKIEFQPVNDKNLVFHEEILYQADLQWLIQFPDNYSDSADKEWPLIIYLHGIGERGNDFEKVKSHGIPKIFHQQTLPAIAVSPLCPKTSMWTLMLRELKAFILMLLKSYPIDKSKVYLTGISMGGYGTWALAQYAPELFAAIIPVCGGADKRLGFPERIRSIGEMPVWAFHGMKDTTIPPEESQILIDELIESGGNATLTLYEDAGHDCWTRTYNSPELYEWLFSI